MLCGCTKAPLYRGTSASRLQLYNYGIKFLFTPQKKIYKSIEASKGVASVDGMEAFNLAKHFIGHIIVLPLP